MSDELKCAPDSKLNELLNAVEEQKLAWALTYTERDGYMCSLLDAVNTEYNGRGETRAGSVAVALSEYFSEPKQTVPTMPVAASGYIVTVTKWAPNKKLECIKIVRQYTGLDLYNAKCSVESTCPWHMLIMEKESAARFAYELVTLGCEATWRAR